MGRKITKIERTGGVVDPTTGRGYARVFPAEKTDLHSLAAQVGFYSNLIQSKPDWEYVGV
jgi:hypothetical protein